MTHPITSSNMTVMIGLMSALLLAACQPLSDGIGDVNDTVRTRDDTHINTQSTSCTNEAITHAYQAKRSDVQVRGCGTIIRALPDDTKGRRHQKILIKLDGVRPAQTLLLVHNIDLAPRVTPIDQGTLLYFYGEYVYNDKGGLVHWTHHDPAARHQGGWIIAGSTRFE